jgi:ABC-type antimicrobial peptide transport system permease subunit
VLELYLLPQRLASWVAAAMGVFGVILAGVGIYGVAAFVASRRAKEVAIRMALGATERDVTAMLVRTGARAPASGVLVGLAVGVVLSIVASKVVPGVRAVDPVALVVVALAVGTLVLAALAFPTRALLRADPMRRLRDE